MKIFQIVGVFLIGMGMLCFFAPWTSTPVGNSAAHDSLGYAAIWSQRFVSVAGARVDWGAFAILAGMVSFFAIVIAPPPTFSETNAARKEKMSEAAHSPGAAAIGAIPTGPITRLTREVNWFMGRCLVIRLTRVNAPDIHFVIVFSPLTNGTRFSSDVKQ